MTNNQITKGVKITIDTSDIETKFTKSVEALNASLTKSQRSLGLFYDDTGLLVNALGQCVEGLSNSQIRLGQYVDSLGQVHTVQGGLVEGLNRSQIAMGQFSDEAGNVYDRLGNLIGQTEKAKRAAEAEAKAFEDANKAQELSAHDMSDSFGKVADGIGKIAGQFATFSAVLLQSGEDADGFREKLARGLQGLATAAGTFKTSMDGVKAFTEAKAVIFPALASIQTAATSAGASVATLGASATTAGPALAALGGPVGIAAAAIAALGAGLIAFASTKNPAPEYSESFNQLAEKAKQAGFEIKNVADALKVGAFETPADRLDEVTDKMIKAKEALDNAVAENRKNAEAAAEAARYGGMGAGGIQYKGIDTAPLDKAYKDALAEYNAEVDQIVKQAREEQRTEAERLVIEKERLEKVKEQAEKQGNEDVASLMDEQIRRTNEKIAKAKEEEAKASADKAKEERDQYLSSIGIGTYLEEAEKAQKENLNSVESVKSAIQNWEAELEAGRLSREDFDKAVNEAQRQALEAAYKQAGIQPPQNTEEAENALDGLKQAFEAGYMTQEQYDDAVRDATKTQLESAYRLAGLEPPKFDELEEATAGLAKAFRDGVMSEEDYNDAVKRAKEGLAKRKLEGVEQELGVKFDKTSEIDSYEDSVAKLDGLLQEGALQQEQYDYAVKQLKDKVLGAIPGFDELGAVERAEEEYEETLRKAEEALENHLIDDEKLSQIKENAERRLADAKEAAAEAEEQKAKKEQDALKKAEQQKQSTRSKLGIDSLVESLKTPMQKYQDTLKEVEKAYKQGAVSQEEAVMLQQNAVAKYYETLEGASDAFDKTVGEERKTAGKDSPANSLSGGSEALYLALVKNQTNNYQNQIAASTDRLASNSDESLYYSQQSYQYLQTIADNLKSDAVWT